jgi:hypothetical protein
VVVAASRNGPLISDEASNRWALLTAASIVSAWSRNARPGPVSGARAARPREPA